MKSKLNKKGFSLTEVLMAVGILAVGITFIAGVFPVAIHFSTVASERTTAAVAADEAFAKIRLYGRRDLTWLSSLSSTACVDFDKATSPFLLLDVNEFAYPSTNEDRYNKQYFWSALCRRVGENDVQVTVFVCRKTGAASRYWDRKVDGTLFDVALPVPVAVEVSQLSNDELQITDTDGADNIDERSFINDGYTIVDGQTGQMYRVLERYAPPDESVILLDRNWEGGALPGLVWMVPPAVNGSRYPCVAIYQKVIRFSD